MYIDVTCTIDIPENLFKRLPLNLLTTLAKNKSLEEIERIERLEMDSVSIRNGSTWCVLLTKLSNEQVVEFGIYDNFEKAMEHIRDINPFEAVGLKVRLFECRNEFEFKYDKMLEMQHLCVNEAKVLLEKMKEKNVEGEKENDE